MKYVCVDSYHNLPGLILCYLNTFIFDSDFKGIFTIPLLDKGMGSSGLFVVLSPENEIFLHLRGFTFLEIDISRT